MFKFFHFARRTGFVFPKGSQREREQFIEELFTLRAKKQEKTLLKVNATLTATNSLSTRERFEFLGKEMHKLKWSIK